MDVSAAAHATALWVGLHLVLLLVLSVLVVRHRRQHRVGIGDGEIPELARAVRAFGNAAEYAPTALAGLVALTVVGAPALLIHVIGVALFGGRVAHAFAISRNSGASMARTVGMLLTWSAYVAAAAALLFFAIP